MGGELEGASTITQQFVRNTILSDEMRDISFKRKIREMYISQKLEEQYSKDEILLMYLNTINYGSGAYGIEAAAERYFSKDAKAAHAERGGHARGHSPVAHLQQPHRLPGQLPEAPQHRARPHGVQRGYHGRRRPTR